MVCGAKKCKLIDMQSNENENELEEGTKEQEREQGDQGDQGDHGKRKVMHAWQS